LSLDQSAVLTNQRPIEAWSGAFGDAYVERNRADDARITQRKTMWRTILPSMQDAPPKSVLEIGANVGINLRALQDLSDAKLYALEPNGKARNVLQADNVVPADNILAGTAGRIDLPDAYVDLVFTSGVLIHVSPDQLPAAYREMHRVSARYLLTIEYFAAEPEEKLYRGHEGLLFKRDFGALWLDMFPELQIADYGFFWRPATGLDNLTWWLLRKPTKLE
jgi:spore coat polysaccharide biosynthesis protein SpsF